MAKSKIFKSCAEAVADIFDGASVMVGGFGSFGGLPINLILALADQGARDLTLIANMGGVGFELSHRIKPGGYQDSGILFENGQVKKFIGSVPALGGMPPTSPLERLHQEGKLEVETVPQGTLAERIRCAAGGLGGFFTPVGVGTVVAEGKESRVIDGREYLLER
ncbi:MAG: 3-oxoacid CoA-transferase subunit A, partial [Chloroflexota bacterium]